MLNEGLYKRIEEQVALLAKRKEDWLKEVSRLSLPKPIYRAVIRHGVNCSPFVKNWLARHTQLREHKDGRTQYCIDGKVRAEATFKLLPKNLNN